MWRRIHSNRDPGDTLYSEIRKEFTPYFSIAGRVAKSVLLSYPRLIFSLMVLLLMSSAILVFVVFSSKQQVAVVSGRAVTAPVSNGFAQIIQATGKIRETLRLKHIVDSISAKKQLSASDSTVLDSALSRLQHFRSPTK